MPQILLIKLKRYYVNDKRVPMKNQTKIDFEFTMSCSPFL